MKNKLLIFLLCILPAGAVAQRHLISGKVVSGSNPVKDVLVVNISAEKEVKTDAQGLFKIEAQKGDSLFITDPGIENIKLAVTDDVLKTTQFIEVTLTSHYQLEEMVIEKDKKLTAEGLRIVPKGVAIYTPAERKIEGGRRLATAEQGIAINTEAIINIFNGRRKALKNRLHTERNEQYLEVLTTNYDEEAIVSKFNIPKENAMGFLYYAVGDTEVIAAIKAKNPTLTEALMSELALKYLELLTEE